jgi:hypothetical protein
MRKSIVGGWLAVLVTSALAAPIAVVDQNQILETRSPMRSMAKFGLTVIPTAHESRILGNYQQDIDAADPAEILGKSWKGQKGSKGITYKLQKARNIL